MGAVSIPVIGWSPHGHQVIAFIAYQNLTAAAKARVGVLLTLNPMYKSWIKELPASASQERKTRRAFIQAAKWADDIKFFDEYVDDGPDNGNTPPDSPSASQNIGYSDKNRHKYWHFIDAPFSDDGTHVKAAAVPNALTEIVLMRTALSSPSTPDPIKSYDLVWLIHLVGDVHQPLHAAARFTHADPDGDNGGNDVSLTCTSGGPCSSNLHAFWDARLGTSKNFADITAQGDALNGLPVPPDPELNNPNAWIDQSTALARTDVYKTPGGATLGDPHASIDATYITHARSVAERRAIIGARRLAALINDALGQ